MQSESRIEKINRWVNRLIGMSLDSSVSREDLRELLIDIGHELDTYINEVAE